MNITEELLKGTLKIHNWGLGYIGTTTAWAYASRGVKVIGTDIEEERCSLFREGKSTVQNLEEWMGFAPSLFAERGLLEATTDYTQLLTPESLVHFISVPTEKDGFPCSKYIEDVLRKLGTLPIKDMPTKPIIYIESTITMNYLHDLIYPILNETLGEGNYILSVCPRRDWFDENRSHHIGNTTRVVSATEDIDTVEKIINIVSPDTRRATSPMVACITKAMENAVRAVCIQTIYQMALAYDEDVVEIMRLVATKWNNEFFHPNHKMAGYCLNVAPLYLQMSADRPQYLSIFSSAIETNNNMPSEVALAVQRRDVKKVMILGLSYKADVPVWTESATLDLCKNFRHMEIDVAVHDPYFTKEQIEAVADCTGVEGNYTEQLRGYDAILVVADHKYYQATQQNDLFEATKDCKLIIDGVGLWEDIDFPEHTKYYRIGSKGWRGD